MAEITHEIREVIKQKDGTIKFKFYQEQKYTEEQRKNMLKSWKKELQQKQDWLKNYPKIKAEAIKETEQTLQKMKEKIETDIKNLKEGINLWENVKNE